MAWSGLARLVAVALLGAALCAAQPRGRILGGQEAEAHARPYMASVQVNGSHRCGGALLTARWVLSAAHCLEDVPEEPAGPQVQVLLGAHSLAGLEPSQQRYNVSRAVRHPNSSAASTEHDLVLLQLPQNATLGAAVRALPWPSSDRDLPPETLCDVAGWGVVTHAGRRPDRLQHLALTVLDRDTCNLRVHHDGAVTEGQLCAQSRRRDTCRGDSGGPLVCGGVVEGVVTAGPRVCGNGRKPGIYTRVAAYLDWIQATLEAPGTEREPAGARGRR